MMQCNSKFNSKHWQRWMLSLIIMVLYSHTVSAQDAGKSRSSRIIGGEETTIAQWPWQVFLNIDNNSQCGGTLIADRWVLTAGHCVDGETSESPEQLRVIMLKNSSGGNQGLGAEPEQIIVHPEFKVSEITFDNDIALVRLPERLNQETINLLGSGFAA
ncbi:MAG: secreted trypsin-like serine protease, partial [Planctomycetota bacterium]